ncbi:MAG: CheY-like chemotaxis protein [Janthinobacterium sp.]|jgi:CheY-like chemotaxis protein
MSAKMTKESSTPPTVSETATSGWLIDDDFPDADQQFDSATEPWRILIIDDDVDVHVVTKFSLSNACFMGRRLSFLHAYSGTEALAVLRKTPDIAMVLLDVIMETDDAGLRVVRQIRDELDNKLVRIVLRTGQPGLALEHSIILDYNINDFWCKTDLTTRKLFTTVISSLRAYADLQAAEHSIVALRTALTQSRQLHSALEQHTMLLTLNQDSNIVDAGVGFCAAFGYLQSALLGRAIPCPPEQQERIAQKLAQGDSWTGDLSLQTSDGSAQQLCATFVPLEGADNLASGKWLVIAIAQRVGADAS